MVSKCSSQNSLFQKLSKQSSKDMKRSESVNDWRIKKLSNSNSHAELNVKEKVKEATEED